MRLSRVRTIQPYCPRPGEPDFVGSASVEMLGKAFDQGAGLAQRRYDRRTVERLIEKKGERLRRP